MRSEVGFFVAFGGLDRWRLRLVKVYERGDTGCRVKGKSVG